MKFDAAPAQKRSYRQGARAEAAEATARRIVQAFLRALERKWLEDITLDQVAGEAGVTVQTVIRRFGGKEGLLIAVGQEIGRQVNSRRDIPVGDLETAVRNLVDDYEVSGDMVIRMLAQEERFPALKPLLAFGRSEHRRWTSEVCAPLLQAVPADKRAPALDAMVAALDAYVWKLVRRDMGRSPDETRAVILGLARGVLAEFNSNH